MKHTTASVFKHSVLLQPSNNVFFSHTKSAPASVRPGAAGLLTDIECSRVRDSSWMYLTSFVTTRIGVELAVVQGNYSVVL